MENVKIFVATHKRIEITLPACYTVIHVGSKGKPDYGFLRDETGESISEKNDSFCELTGLYWMWKNAEEDIVGLCHYRRYFSQIPFDSSLKHILSEKNIMKRLNECDIILPQKTHLGGKTVREQYEINHIAKDLEITEKVIHEMFPQYSQAFEKTMQMKSIYLTNMFICKKELADEYCEWLFSILFEIEKRIDISEYDAVQKRVFGYLAERLFNVWLIYREPKISFAFRVSTELSFVKILKDFLKKG